MTAKNDSSSADLEIVFVIEGPVPQAARARPEDVVRDLTAKAPRPVIFARVKLTTEESRRRTSGTSPRWSSMSVERC